MPSADDDARQQRVRDLVALAQRTAKPRLSALGGAGKDDTGKKCGAAGAALIRTFDDVRKQMLEKDVSGLKAVSYKSQWQAIESLVNHGTQPAKKEELYRKQSAASRPSDVSSHVETISALTLMQRRVSEFETSCESPLEPGAALSSSLTERQLDAAADAPDPSFARADARRKWNAVGHVFSACWPPARGVEAANPDCDGQAAMDAAEATIAKLRKRLSALSAEIRQRKVHEESLRKKGQLYSSKLSMYRVLCDEYRDMFRRGLLVNVPLYIAENRFYRRERVELYQRLYGHNFTALPPIEPVWDDQSSEVEQLLEAKDEACKVEIRKEREHFARTTQAVEQALSRVAASAAQYKARVMQGKVHIQLLEKEVMQKHDATQFLSRADADHLNRSLMQRVEVLSKETAFLSTQNFEARQKIAALTEQVKKYDELNSEVETLKDELDKTTIEKKKAVREAEEDANSKVAAISSSFSALRSSYQTALEPYLLRLVEGLEKIAAYVPGFLLSLVTDLLQEIDSVVGVEPAAYGEQKDAAAKAAARVKGLVAAGAGKGTSSVSRLLMDDVGTDVVGLTEVRDGEAQADDGATSSSSRPARRQKSTAGGRSPADSSIDDRKLAKKIPRSEPGTPARAGRSPRSGGSSFFLRSKSTRSGTLGASFRSPRKSTHAITAADDLEMHCSSSPHQAPIVSRPQPSRQDASPPPFLSPAGIDGKPQNFLRSHTFDAAFSGPLTIEVPMVEPGSPDSFAEGAGAQDSPSLRTFNRHRFSTSMPAAPPGYEMFHPRLASELHARSVPAEDYARVLSVWTDVVASSPRAGGFAASSDFAAAAAAASPPAVQRIAAVLSSSPRAAHEAPVAALEDSLRPKAAAARLSRYSFSAEERSVMIEAVEKKFYGRASQHPPGRAPASPPHSKRPFAVTPPGTAANPEPSVDAPPPGPSQPIPLTTRVGPGETTPPSVATPPPDGLDPSRPETTAPAVEINGAAPGDARGAPGDPPENAASAEPAAAAEATTPAPPAPEGAEGRPAAAPDGGARPRSGTDPEVLDAAASEGIAAGGSAAVAPGPSHPFGSAPAPDTTASPSHGACCGEEHPGARPPGPNPNGGGTSPAGDALPEPPSDRENDGSNTLAGGLDPGATPGGVASVVGVGEEDGTPPPLGGQSPAAGRELSGVIAALREGAGGSVELSAAERDLVLSAVLEFSSEAAREPTQQVLRARTCCVCCCKPVEKADTEVQVTDLAVKKLLEKYADLLELSGSDADDPDEDDDTQSPLLPPPPPKYPPPQPLTQPRAARRRATVPAHHPLMTEHPTALPVRRASEPAFASGRPASQPSASASPSTQSPTSSSPADLFSRRHSSLRASGEAPPRPRSRRLWGSFPAAAKPSLARPRPRTRRHTACSTARRGSSATSASPAAARPAGSACSGLQATEASACPSASAATRLGAPTWLVEKLEGLVMQAEDRSAREVPKKLARADAAVQTDPVQEPSPAARSPGGVRKGKAAPAEDARTEGPAPAAAEPEAPPKTLLLVSRGTATDPSPLDAASGSAPAEAAAPATPEQQQPADPPPPPPELLEELDALREANDMLRVQIEKAEAECEAAVHEEQTASGLRLAAAGTAWEVCIAEVREELDAVRSHLADAVADKEAAVQRLATSEASSEQAKRDADAAKAAAVHAEREKERELKAITVSTGRKLQAMTKQVRSAEEETRTATLAAELKRQADLTTVQRKLHAETEKLRRAEEAAAKLQRHAAEAAKEAERTAKDAADRTEKKQAKAHRLELHELATAWKDREAKHEKAAAQHERDVAALKAQVQSLELASKEARKRAAGQQDRDAAAAARKAAAAADKAVAELHARHGQEIAAAAEAHRLALRALDAEAKELVSAALGREAAVASRCSALEADLSQAKSRSDATDAAMSKQKVAAGWRACLHAVELSEAEARAAAIFGEMHLFAGSFAALSASRALSADDSLAAAVRAAAQLEREGSEALQMVGCLSRRALALHDCLAAFLRSVAPRLPSAAAQLW
ncbi:hypothetical protein DIPPA_34145 [Diplonema papillatum]|nr:hypothetical protein DIPPA_34145 [Diplonema papillatum]